MQQQGALLLHSPVSSDRDVDVSPLRNCAWSVFISGAQAGREVKTEPSSS